jgi:glutathione synthase/RimK-type ligase-like ATP-grasp enzyme
VTIAVLGDTKDLCNAYIVGRATQRGLDTILLDESSLGADWDLTMDPAQRTGTIETRGRRIRLSRIKGVMCRFNPYPKMPVKGLDTARTEFCLTERRAALVHFAGMLDCGVANRPSRGRANASKPFQMRELEKLGARVPTWVVTSSPEDARRFMRRFRGQVIVKSVSGLRSRVRMADESLLDALAEGSAPVLLQRRIPGDDVRVHVVDRTCFATAIRSSGGVDYRYDRARRKYTRIDLPRHVERLCRKIRSCEGLFIAGIDFRLSPAGEWFCLESNPMPTFLPYEMETGQPIADTILDAMLAGAQ